jgi:hypothetical protein
MIAYNILALSFSIISVIFSILTVFLVWIIYNDLKEKLDALNSKSDVYEKYKNIDGLYSNKVIREKGR